MVGFWMILFVGQIRNAIKCCFLRIITYIAMDCIKNTNKTAKSNDTYNILIKKKRNKYCSFGFWISVLKVGSKEKEMVKNAFQNIKKINKYFFVL
jgi:hypothetical protein